jgi:NADPH-dependent 2,4-dienoyl-CoA reductase/sulfur reductase-like enzyme/rhodanese-related sulfurtransferase
MKIIIIGSVAGGTSVAAKARRNDGDAEIKIYDMDRDISYSGCGLPYYIGEDYIERENLTPRDPKWFKKRFDIDIFTGHKVTKIDNDKKEITVENLETGAVFIDNYDKLVLATGASPIKPNIPGVESDNVFYLRNVKSADKIVNFIAENSPKKAVIAGAGYIGLELLENLSNLGIEVTVVEKSDRAMSKMDKDMSVYVETYLEKKGVQVILGEAVEKVENNGRLVKTSSGTEIETDMIVFCIGVKPNTILGENIGLDLASNKAIIVNNKMETSISDIYAVGDCAMSYSVLDGQELYVPLGSTANKMGRIAGDVITGGNLTFRGILGTGIFKVFDLAVAQTGMNEEQAREKGYDVELIHNIKPNQTEYLKSSREMIIKAVADRKTEKLLGVQIIGENGVDKRIDVFATAMTFGAKVGDLFHLDLAYAPPFSTTKDPVIYTGMVLNNAINGKNKILTPEELLNKRSEYIVIDVRANNQYEAGHIEGAINIPLGELKEKTCSMDKNIKYVVHCNKGVTGNAAQNILLNLGFEKVYNLSGGYKNYTAYLKCIK